MIILHGQLGKRRVANSEMYRAEEFITGTTRARGATDAELKSTTRGTSETPLTNR
jgi:hypothetical protein